MKNLERQIEKLNNQENTDADSIERVCSDLSRLSLDTRTYRKEMQIVASLSYQERPTRHEIIPQAYRTTFEWGLKKLENASKKSTSLRRWLAGNSSLFWVSGKPGSGKSTFMKFIADHLETRHYLQEWAGSREVLVASHYFTVYGTPMQRSLEGLLRSLLYDILKQQPAFIPKLLPTRWELKLGQPEWTQSELESVLRRVAEETEVPVNICFFIDGLDEYTGDKYTGDHLDICHTLKELSQAPFIKVCVSSRPWNVFEDALGDSEDSKLYMHELTQDDIRNYTACRLRDHPPCSILESEASGFSLKSLIGDIVVKANGVFLWVTLVTLRLREGLTNDDRISDLKRRLSSFPADLKQFFKYILESVDTFYHGEMASTLLFALHAQEPLNVEMFRFHYLEDDYENYALKEPTEPISSAGEERDRMFSSVSRRINGRTKGLLERQGDQVVFLHRTVYDFLHTPEMSEFLKEKSRSEFCPSLSLFQASIACTKRTTFNEVYEDTLGDPMRECYGFVETLRRCFGYAHHSDKEGQRPAALTAALLGNMEDSVIHMLRRKQIGMAYHSMARGMYRHLVLEAGVSGYLRNKLSDPGYFRSDHATRFRSPLSCVLDYRDKLSEHDHQPFLLVLLKSDQDPNLFFKDQSPWTEFVVKCCPHVDLPDKNMLGFALEKGILNTLLQHRADPNTQVDVKGRHGSRLKVPAWLLFLMAAPFIWSTPWLASYERDFDLMLDRVRNPDNVKVYKYKGPQWLEIDYWDVCDNDFPLPTDLCRRREKFLTRVFGNVLIRITEEESLKKAQGWVERALTSDIRQELRTKISTLWGRNMNPPQKRCLEDDGIQNHRPKKNIRKKKH